MGTGNIVYQGPREKVVAYFENLGYSCPPLVDVADYLVQLPTNEGVRFIKPGLNKTSVPHGSEQLSEAWKSSDLFAEMAREVSGPHDSHKSVKTEWRESDRRPYPGTVWYHSKLVMERQFRFIRRNAQFVKGRIMQTLIIGALVSSLFNGLDKTDFRSMMGFIFFSGLSLALVNFSLIPEVMSDREVFYKQHGSMFYPTISYLIAQNIVMLPLNVIETVAYSTMAYWSVGMSSDDGGSRFFVFMLLVFTFSITMAQIFRTICYMTPSAVTAQTVCGLVTMISVLFSGYICPRDNIPDPWIWAYYINPVAYVIQALMINEFESEKYNFPSFGTSEAFGISVLDKNSFNTNYEWVWYSFAILLLMYFSCFFVTVYVLSNVTFAAGYVPVPSEVEAGEDADNEADNKQMPFDLVSFAFKNIWYTVQLSNKEEIDLLKGVDGYFRAGTMTALMGSSGAGKTTLLDVLAGRKNSGVIKGTMTVNGKPKDEKTFRRLMAYVEQFDSLSPSDTAREAVEFSAALRLPKETSSEARHAWVEYVLTVLELIPLQNTMVGDESVGGMSFEQKKRVSIGVELASNPSILFLDEPTIHQPSTYIFSNFDSLLLLRRGGQTVFFGELGRNSENLIKYFTDVPGVTPIQLNQNPASWMLDQIGAGTSSSSSSVDMHEYYKRSPLGQENNLTVDTMCMTQDDAVSVKVDHYGINDSNTYQMYNASDFMQVTYSVLCCIIFLIIDLLFLDCVFVAQMVNKTQFPKLLAESRI